jgi:hypothetical protein
VTPEANLLFAIFKQTILDYIKLDPDSDCISADFYESETEDYTTAEDIIFNGQKIYYGQLILTFNDLCELFKEIIHLTPKQLKNRIIQKAIHF